MLILEQQTDSIADTASIESIAKTLEISRAKVEEYLEKLGLSVTRIEGEYCLDYFTFLKVSVHHFKSKENNAIAKLFPFTKEKENNPIFGNFEMKIDNFYLKTARTPAITSVLKMALKKLPYSQYRVNYKRYLENIILKTPQAENFINHIARLYKNPELAESKLRSAALKILKEI